MEGWKPGDIKDIDDNAAHVRFTLGEIEIYTGSEPVTPNHPAGPEMTSAAAPEVVPAPEAPELPEEQVEGDFTPPVQQETLAPEVSSTGDEEKKS